MSFRRTSSLKQRTRVSPSSDHAGRCIAAGKLVTLLALLVVASLVTVAADTAPPELIALSFSLDPVDTTEGPVTVTLTATVLDETGIFGCEHEGEISMDLFSPSGTQHFGKLLLPSGANTYTCDLDFEQYCEAGTWQITELFLLDCLGNHDWLNQSELDALGLDSEIEVVSTPDTTAPELLAFDFAPKSIDTGGGPATVTCTATVTDDLSGVTYVNVDFWGPPDETLHQDQVDGRLLHVAGDAYVGELEFPQHSDPGTWVIYVVSMHDAIGNYGYYTASDVRTLGFPADLAVSDTDFPPTVLEITVSDTLISDADDGATFTVTVDFSEAMTTDGSADPILIFSPAVGSTLTSTGGSWPGSDTYQHTYSIGDANVDVDSVTIDIIGAKDAVGNTQADYTPEHEFEIDTLNPTVTFGGSTSDGLYLQDFPHDDFITDADIGDANSGLVYVHFSEPMATDGSVDPVFTFIPNVDSTLPTAGAYTWWPTDSVYGWLVWEADANVDVDSVMIDVEGARDEHGNLMADYVPEHEFEIDTENPSVASVVVDTNPVYEGDLTQFVTVTYDEVMCHDGTADPTISFSHGTWTSLGDGAWIPDTGYISWRETFTLTDNNEEFYDRTPDVDVVTVDATGAKDIAGNDQADYTPQAEFDIDTQQPTLIDATSTTPDGTYTTGGSINLTLTFSEDVVLTTTGLWVLLDVGGARATTLARHVGTGHWSTLRDTVDWLTYVVASDENSSDLTLLSYRTSANNSLLDWAGNVIDFGIPAPGANIADYKDIVVDTVAPTVASVSVSDTLISDADAAGTFTVTVDYSEPMASWDSPNVAFSPGVSSTLTAETGAWLDADTYVTSFTVVDVGVTVNGVDILVPETADVAGNLSDVTQEADAFAIDTENPTATIWLDDTQITDADVGGFHYMYVSFSEDMDTTLGQPYRSFDPNVTTQGGTGTLAHTTPAGWTSSRTFRRNYFVFDTNDPYKTVDLHLNGNAQDLAGNAVEPIPTSNLAAFIIDTENPTVVSITALDPTPTNADTISWQIVFNEDVQGFDRSDLTFASSGTAAFDFLSSVVTGAGTTYTYTLPGIAGDGTISLVIHNVHTIEDLRGNPREEAEFIGGEYTIDNTPPEISGMPGDLAVMAQPRATSATVTWDEPVATDATAGIATFTPTHPSGTDFPIGKTEVVYTAVDTAGNVATESFNVTVSGYVASIEIVPSGDSGHGAFLDRVLPLEDGEGPPQVGTYTLAAQFEIGDPATGSCRLLDSDGSTLVASYVIVELYRLTFDGNDQFLEQLSHEVVHYNWENGCYDFSCDTSELEPGYYIVYLVFPDGSEQEICIEVIPAPAA